VAIRAGRGKEILRKSSMASRVQVPFARCSSTSFSKAVALALPLLVTYVTAAPVDDDADDGDDDDDDGDDDNDDDEEDDDHVDPCEGPGFVADKDLKGDVTAAARPEKNATPEELRPAKHKRTAGESGLSDRREEPSTYFLRTP
jgi:hypothetical protein